MNVVNIKENEKPTLIKYIVKSEIKNDRISYSAKYNM